ncbi:MULTISPECIES: DUF416 family protein [unclassified Nostoc]|uniref:DUF416 family protein n=1 Tax=unclassified Nostoc TaxID=2593658 RepID=UPI000B953ABC|nr:DUF416 family protein [Nostoc sp. 'Peltigera membranacea cyanobiont' 232]OYE01229.1 hypothetical protein CDG79_30725 [Nostoc sp. 'Peltigera membranacea cyanobiont' 232]
MNLNYGEFHILERELEAFPPMHRIALANHPFTVREMAKQSEDLQHLQETPTLTTEFLQRLRTSSENGGKSLLDLS